MPSGLSRSSSEIILGPSVMSASTAPSMSPAVSSPFRGELAIEKGHPDGRLQSAAGRADGQ